jgi:tetratricopeptide (TPR) repeat protein
MKRFSSIFITSFLMILITALPVVAQSDDTSPPTSGRDLQVEQEIHNRLATLNPEAVPIFQAATQALDNDDLKTARQAYMQVLHLAPSFPDALRRLSYIELAENNIQAALETARQAFAADGSAYNHIALAQMLLATKNPDHAEGALLHAQAAVAVLPDDPEANLILLHAAMSNGDEPVIRQTIQKVLELAPDNPLSHYFAGLVAAHDGYWEEAQQELLLSQELGMPPEDVQSALNSGIMSQARLYHWGRRGTYTTVGWLLGFPILFLVGIV